METEKHLAFATTAIATVSQVKKKKTSLSLHVIGGMLCQSK